MTEALVSGLIAGDLCRPDQLLATDSDSARRTHLEHTYRIHTHADNRATAEFSHNIVLSVAPQVLDGVLTDLAKDLQSHHLVTSVVAGCPIARVQKHLASVGRIVRAMPNTPTWVRAGVTALSFSENITEPDRSFAQTLFESVGAVVTVDERLMDAVTGLSGSGPAYVYIMIEALADGGVTMGLPRDVAQRLAAQTLLGAAHMVLESGEHPGRLKDRVASPGGSTIAGLHELEKGRVRAALMTAVEAATLRSKELGLEEKRIW